MSDKSELPRGVHIYERPTDHLSAQGKPEPAGFYWQYSHRWASNGPYPTETAAIEAAWKTTK